MHQKGVSNLMKCSQCGKEFTEEELAAQNGVCPECGGKISDQKVEQTKEKASQHQETAETESEKKEKKKRKILIIAVAVIAAAAVLASAAFLTKGSMMQANSENHINPTELAYTTDEGIGLANGNQTVELYENAAEEESDREEINEMFSYSTPYIGKQNYVEMENGDTIYLPLNITSTEEMTGKLCLKTAAGEESVLDENAAIIYCHSKNAVYYNKLEDDKLVQVQYKNGTLTPVSEIVGEENIVVVSASDDDSLLQVLQLDEDQNAVAGGYYYNGKLHLLDTKYTVANVSKQGDAVYLITSESETSLVDLYRVSNLETEETELIGSGISEIAFYDNGSMTFLADCDASQNQYNPVGSVYWYDGSTKTAEKAADNAVALLETSLRSNGWMNENGRDMTTSEMARQIAWDKPLYEGQVHYIDAQGNLCVSSAQAATIGESGMQGITICEDFYDVDNYTMQSDITFATATQTALTWSRGADLYRYNLGSMEEPQMIPLNESVEEKAQEVTAQVGYITIGSGDILEETNQTLVLKKFSDESSVTVLENVGTLTLAGLDNAGTHIYFTSEDGSLYSKSLENRSNPKRIDSDVVQATATSEGLYYLVSVENTQEEMTVGESGEQSAPEEQYNLMFLQYGQSKGELIKEDVNSIMAVNVQK